MNQNIQKTLEKLDFSMKNLCVNLVTYSECDPMYRKTLATLAQQFQYCKLLLSLERDNINNTFYFKYSDINKIELLLIKNGYIRQPNKNKTR